MRPNRLLEETIGAQFREFSTDSFMQFTGMLYLGWRIWVVIHLGVDVSQDNIERDTIQTHHGSRMHFLHLEDGLVRGGCHKLVIE